MNEDIKLLQWIFERELKPPFKVGKRNEFGHISYVNIDNRIIGTFIPEDDMFKMVGDPFFEDIRIKVCQMFDIPKNTLQCRYVVESNLRSWFENKLNFKIETLYVN